LRRWASNERGGESKPKKPRGVGRQKNKSRLSKSQVYERFGIGPVVISRGVKKKVQSNLTFKAGNP